MIDVLPYITVARNTVDAMSVLCVLVSVVKVA